MCMRPRNGVPSIRAFHVGPGSVDGVRCRGADDIFAGCNGSQPGAMGAQGGTSVPMFISRSALLVVAVATAVAMVQGGALQSNSSRVEVGCTGAPPAKPRHGYRDGRCGGCECCPLRWSCLEMHSRGYRCAERTSVPVQNRMLSLAPSGRWTVGDAVEASLSDLPWTSLPKCHSYLPPGVHLELNASSDGTSSVLSLRGTLGYDPTRPGEYSWDLEIDGVVGDGSSEQYTVQRVRGTVTVSNVAHERGKALEAEVNALASNDAKARAAGLAGFRAFEQYYNERSLSHERSVRHMYSSEQELASVLDDTPAVSGGIYWNWAGGLYMNLHKLLEDVLVDGCEHHFEQGLLYGPDDEVLRSNLDGCFAKRLLESAKFMWLQALSHLADPKSSMETLTASRQLLQHAAAVKDGWGWGVNNGDIHLSLASVRVLLSFA